MRCLLSIGLIVFAAPLSDAANRELLNEATRSAESITYFHAKTSIHRAQNPVMPESVREFASLAQKHRETDWWVLTRHASPKVRSLAIRAIAWKDNPKSLDRMLPLLNDREDSFLYQDVGQLAGSPPWDVKQQVSDFAEALVDEYMQAAGFRWGVEPGSSQSPGFNEYWQERKDRDECYSWLSVSLYRAASCFSPSSSDGDNRKRPFIEIRERIDALPFPDRQWSLLGLSTPTENGTFDQHGDLLATHAKRIEAAKALGSDRLINMFRNRIESEDPDIRLPSQDRIGGSFPRWKVQSWLFQHAEEIFHPEDADKILQAISTIDAHLTAARLSPRAASRYLEAALDQARKKQRANAEFSRFYVALRRLDGQQYQKEILDWWFFANARYVGDIRPMSDFLRQAEGRPLLRLIWQDERCETMVWERITGLVGISRLPGQEQLVSSAEFDKARPFFGGQDRVFKGGKSKKYVRDPAIVKEVTAIWRARALRSLSKELR